MSNFYFIINWALSFQTQQVRSISQRYLTIMYWFLSIGGRNGDSITSSFISCHWTRTPTFALRHCNEELSEGIVFLLTVHGLGLVLCRYIALLTIFLRILLWWGCWNTLYITCPWLKNDSFRQRDEDNTIRIGSTPTFLYFDLYLYSAYAAHSIRLFLSAIVYFEWSPLEPKNPLVPLKNGTSGNAISGNWKIAY